jgi:hypothetical protein
MHIFNLTGLFSILNVYTSTKVASLRNFCSPSPDKACIKNITMLAIFHIFAGHVLQIGQSIKFCC